MIKNIVFDFGGVIVDIDRDKANLTLMNLENNWEIYADESLLWKKPNRHGWASSTK